MTRKYDNLPLIEAAIPQLELLYILRNRYEILSYLQSYPFLTAFLLEAATRIGRYFEKSSLSLEVLPDRESRGTKYLMLYIGTDLDADSAVDRLKRLDAEWWLDTIPTVKGKLSIDVEFQ